MYSSIFWTEALNGRRNLLVEIVNINSVADFIVVRNRIAVGKLSHPSRVRGIFSRTHSELFSQWHVSAVGTGGSLVGRALVRTAGGFGGSRPSGRPVPPYEYR